MAVRGRGGVTIRRGGAERVWQRTSFPLSELKGPRDAAAWMATRPFEPDGAGISPMLEEVRVRGARGADALGRRDIGGIVAAILDMESVLHDWAADLAGTDERDLARAEMRQLIVHLGGLVRAGGRDDVREYLAPLVDVLLSLRGNARREQRFSDADRLRAILAQCGVEVQDTPTGTAWSLAGAD